MNKTAVILGVGGGWVSLCFSKVVGHEIFPKKGNIQPSSALLIVFIMYEH